MNARRRPVKHRRLRSDTRAATVVEYGLIVALIVIAIVAAIISVADVTTAMWNDVATKVSRAR